MPAFSFPFGKCYLGGKASLRKYTTSIYSRSFYADALAEVCGAHPHWTYCMRAVGPKNATLFFDGSDPLGGHGSEVSHTPDYKPFPVSPLDRLLEENPLPPPFLVKLNVHGIEIPNSE